MQTSDGSVVVLWTMTLHLTSYHQEEERSTLYHQEERRTEGNVWVNCSFKSAVCKMLYNWCEVLTIIKMILNWKRDELLCLDRQCRQVLTLPADLRAGSGSAVTESLCCLKRVTGLSACCSEAAEILSEDLDERYWKWNISGAAGGICVPCSVGVCSVMED